MRRSFLDRQATAEAVKFTEEQMQAAIDGVEEAGRGAAKQSEKSPSETEGSSNGCVLASQLSLLIVSILHAVQW